MNATFRTSLVFALLAGCCPFLTQKEGTEIPKYDAAAPVDDTVLARWVQTDPGMDAVAQLVADTGRPMELRVVALISATRAGQADRVAAILSELQSGDAEQVAARAGDAIASLLGADPTLTASAKKALLGALPRWPKAGEALAAWAYEGVGAAGVTSQTREILVAAAARLTVEERRALGAASIPAAGAFLAFDVEPSESLALLKVLLPDHPAAGGALAYGLTNRWHSKAATPEELEAATALPPEMAAGLLLAVATSATHPEEVRGPATTRALDLVAAGGAGSGVASGLVKLVRMGDPTVQWKAAQLAIRAGGAGQLDALLGAVRDDPSKAPGPAQADGMLGLCEELREKGAGDEAVTALRAELKAGDITSIGLSIVCLKVVFAQAAVPDLKALAKAKGKPQDLPLSPFAGGETTLAKLAQNALDGLAMKPSLMVAGVGWSEIAPLLAIIDHELLATGPAYKKLVVQRTAEWKAKHP